MADDGPTSHGVRVAALAKLFESAEASRPPRPGRVGSPSTTTGRPGKLVSIVPSAMVAW